VGGMYRLQRESDPRNYRRQFADFLDRHATSPVDGEEWSSFVVTQYPDEFLEVLRRCTVRLAIGHLPVGMDSEEGGQLLRGWAIALRSSLHLKTATKNLLSNTLGRQRRCLRD
jgi:hypothetical protein